MSEKHNYKHNLAEKVKLAEQVKMKAIAEAEKVKKEYVELVDKENKASEKKVTKNSTSKVL